MNKMKPFQEITNTKGDLLGNGVEKGTNRDVFKAKDWRYLKVVIFV